MISGQIGFRAWLREQFRPPQLGQTIFNSLAIVSACFTALDVVRLFARWFAKTEDGRFETYLWVSFIAAVGTPVLWVALYRMVRQDLSRARKRTKISDHASHTQHRMAEAVRRCAANPTTYPIGEDLKHVVSLLIEYLRHRLGEADYAVTIKRIDAGKLRKVFRSDGQNLTTRCKGDNIAFEESPIYVRFARGASSRKMVFIGDTEQVPSLEDAFRDRARECGYRTVVGFPLRQPVAFDADTQTDQNAVKFANLLGFLSIDAPSVGAFEHLLKSSGPESRRDDDREPRDDLDVFYGSADSIATILMLTSAAVGRGE